MTLTVSVARRARRLPRPASNARGHWLHRESCIITLESIGGARGQGEAAPLPGFSPDDVRDCEQALGALDLRGIPARLGPDQDPKDELRRASLRLPRGLPAARAALEAALLDLWARDAGVPAWALLRPGLPAPEARPFAALLAAEPEQTLEQARVAHARGITTFKLKIGRAFALQRELAAVRALRAELGPSARLRLDANQALSLADACHYLPSFAECELEFIEEPCVPHELARLRSLGLPLALDESLALGARPERGDRALILKPTLLGGVSACLELAAEALALGIEVILSHAFEGPLGLAVSATLALCSGSQKFAQGLDPEGAGLDPLSLPYWAGATVSAWSAPGFGVGEQP